ncbi:MULTISPECIES: GMC family oxidoreductase [unclassified Pseudofrankia]|uniref:GMC family oxidoreductase n=1 Tax=unclassified Pseudofrankia TaxID=2994372 RepID=UPI0008DAA2EE|nr:MULTISPECIES: GMC family oxidoreductase N-terminal domain-containing protein [unclassified Pseudofrankia]MDT3446513.1 GMC family oxidoreductase N-terminal domain-containing protein [Pseudofrankia sp. BMG5.37]OHV55772.1 choline dehydrogenase [Pseudofrankia sp. BMG5.36]
MASYDYVVVGAGSAGCVLANRLTEDGSTRVLLLEAGGADDLPQIRVPAAFGALMGTSVDWGYSTVPQTHLGRSVRVPRGRMLGGSSSMNAMIYIRGDRSDFDGWRDTHGARGWGYDDVLPYFVRSEENARLAGRAHGTCGPQHVEDLAYVHDLSRLWVETAVAQGLPRNDDFNGPTMLGAGLHQVTCRNGRRWSAADGYLRPAMGRPNLTVATDSRATRIVTEQGRAVGVAYRCGNAEHTVRAEIEVLLSAGAVGSPHLLLLSGIGPADHLRDHGVRPVVDIPGVGANLHDHPTVPLAWRTRKTTDLAYMAGTEDAMLQWQRERRGPLASNIAEAAAFFSLDDADPAPCFQVYAGATAFFDDGQGRADAPCFGAVISLLTPRSRGTVSLRSADPDDQPVLDLGIYDEGDDFDQVLAGLRRLHDLVTHEPLSPFLASPYLPEEDAPDDASYAALIRRWTQTMYHLAGSCAMGTGERSVVDPDLRVRGVDGLRVIDASVMPTVTRGNTHAPTLMIAERGADLIRHPPSLNHATA